MLVEQHCHDLCPHHAVTTCRLVSVSITNKQECVSATLLYKLYGSQSVPKKVNLQAPATHFSGPLVCCYVVSQHTQVPSPPHPSHHHTPFCAAAPSTTHLTPFLSRLTRLSTTRRCFCSGDKGPLELSVPSPSCSTAQHRTAWHEVVNACSAVQVQ